MSADREKIESLFDELKEKALGYIDELDKLNSETEDLRTARREAEEKTWAAEEMIAKLEQDLVNATADTVGKDDEIAAIIKERDELKAEMGQINAQLEKVSELYRETSAEKDKLEEKVDVSDLLAIYIILIENIFGGKPHARVLYTLHNTKSVITRKNIISSTGIMPTAVTKAIHDLRNADLVSYDEETQEVKLIKDIL